MSILEQSAFIKAIHPFENLTKVQLEVFAENLDIIYLKKDEVLQKEGLEPEKLYFVIKGLVQEKYNNEVIMFSRSYDFLGSFCSLERFNGQQRGTNKRDLYDFTAT